MIKAYKGFTISVKKELSITGSQEVFYSICRDSDKWFLDDGHSELNIKETMADCIYTIDDYFKYPEKYED